MLQFLLHGTTWPDQDSNTTKQLQEKPSSASDSYYRNLLLW